jgi:MFS family permease
LRRCIEHEYAHYRKRYVLFTRRAIAAQMHLVEAVQGLGAGAITASMQIILSDLVTLRERGTYTGFMALCVVPTHFVSQMSLIPCSSWAFGGGVGPVIGGSLAQQGQWWAFSHSLQIATRFLTDFVAFPIGDGYSVREILSIVLSVL